MAILFTAQDKFINVWKRKNRKIVFSQNMFGQFMPNAININCLLIIFVGYQKQELIIEIEAPI